MRRPTSGPSRSPAVADPANGGPLALVADHPVGPDPGDAVLGDGEGGSVPMVGIGASAGGIAALYEFFDAMAPDRDLVFVVVVHLSPAHDSVLPALLARHTAMPVVSAQDGARVAPNHVYVIPPGTHLSVSSTGSLRVVDVSSEHGRRVTVDMFFRSMADAYGSRAVAVVLSGADGDGALGIKRVKERGGLTIAQDPSEAEQAGMPRSAIGTGMVDWVLRAREIPERMLQYLHRERRVRPTVAGGPPVGDDADGSVDGAAPSEGEGALSDVLVFVRTRTGCDFNGYKRATLLRRIARRMQVNGVETLEDYAVFLRTHPGESGALLADLLISVTNFFRDREAFDALAGFVPSLFEGKGPGQPVRVWVPACATGEEAYSLAMLLHEHASGLVNPPPIQVFGCDLSEEAIRVARAGTYSEAIAADVSAERLERYFTKVGDGYRVRPQLRELVLFAVHDLLKDAPFSRMDLISCRNLLIYLNRDAQERLFETFHFALRANGKLFLGASEAVDERSALFRVVDKRHRIYEHEPAARAGLPIPMGPGTLARTIDSSPFALAPAMVHGKGFSDASAPGGHNLGRDLDRLALAELHFRFVERYAPPSVIVNSEHDIVHLSEHAGRYLRFGGGEPTTNLLRVVHDSLRVELRAALFRAAELRGTAMSGPVTTEIDGRTRRVAMTVTADREIGLLLVVFVDEDPAEASAAGDDESVPYHTTKVARQMEDELERVKALLRDTIEQYEASAEELKASNEELQAMNEELRSATEELETSREEAQSINEELSTVNQELKAKLDELAGANGDLQNLMASTSIATLFLARDLTIKRFTPSSAFIFNLIASDVGRPLAHLRHRLDYPDLLGDAERVVETLVPVEREVSGVGQWFLARLHPYKTVENQVAGVVLTLVDVTDRHRASEALRESEERMRILIEGAMDYAILTVAPDRRIVSWSPGAAALFGYGEPEMIGELADRLFTVEDVQGGEPGSMLARAAKEARAENARWLVRKDGTVFYGSGSVMPLLDSGGALRGFVMILRDLTASKHSEQAMQEHIDEMVRFNAAAVGREARMIELKEEVNRLCARLAEPPTYLLPEDTVADGGTS